MGAERRSSQGGGDNAGLGRGQVGRSRAAHRKEESPRDSRMSETPDLRGGALFTRMRSAGPTRDAGNSPPQEMHASALTHNFVSFRRGVCHIPLDKNPCCRQLSQDPAGTPQDGAHRRKPTSVPHTCAGGRR